MEIKVVKKYVPDMEHKLLLDRVAVKLAPDCKVMQDIFIKRGMNLEKEKIISEYRRLIDASYQPEMGTGSTHTTA